MLWLLTVLSLIGVVFNIFKNRVCFAIWAFTNFTWMVVDWRAGLTEQAALFGVYFALAIWGLLKWRRDGDLDN